MRFIRIERRGRPFAYTILHQSKEISIDLEKLVDKHQIAYRSQSLTKAHPYFSVQQALLIRHALLRSFFLVLRDLRATGTASEALQWQRSADVDPGISAIPCSASTDSQQRDL